MDGSGLVLTPHQKERIHVVGTSGSGKSTLAKQLARRLGYSLIELDALHWLADWREEEPQKFREKLSEKISQPNWILDGNYYSKSSDIQWAEQGGATTVVWCDYSFPKTFVRALKRAFVRAWTKQELWPGTGNRETFRKSFFSHDSVVLWTMISYRHNKRLYSEIIEQNRFPHIHFVRLRNSEQTSSFLKQFD